MGLRRAGFAAVTAAMALLVCTGTAAAQSNYKLAPVGGRTTLVGGTGLAFGRDSASAFLNPATVVRVDPGRLAFSVNFYEISLFTAGRWYQPGPVDRQHFGAVSSDKASVTTADFDALPSSLCLFLRIGDIKFFSGATAKDLRESQARLGLCLATVQSDDFSLNREDYAQATSTGGSRQAQTVRQTFRRIAVGPTYSMYVTNALAMGVSLHVSRAGYRSIYESSATTYGGGAQPITSAFYSAAHGDSYDLSATIGATYRIGRYQTVALAVEAPSLHVFGSGGLNRYTHYDGVGEATSTVTAHGNFSSNTPLRIALGTGIERPWGSAEVNVSYHLPVGPAYRATFDGRAVDVSGGIADDRAASLDLSAQPRGAVNIGVGGEVYVAPGLSLLGGLGSDISAARTGKLADDPINYFASRTHRVSGSFGLGSHGEGGDLLIGGELGYEWGDRLSVNAYQLPPRLDASPTQKFSLLLLIAGTTSFKAIKRAVNDLTEAVDPTKKPEPKKPEPPPPPLKEPSSTTTVPKG